MRLQDTTPAASQAYTFEPRFLSRPVPFFPPVRSDSLLERTVAALLRLIKEHWGMDVVFASGLLPDSSRAGAPIRLADGSLYGMLYCAFTRPDDAADPRELRRLQMSAQLAARMIDGADLHGILT